jgi:amino acid transporter
VKVNFGALGLVAAVSLFATIVVVTIAAVGVRALANAQESARNEQPDTLQRVVGFACLGLAGLAVLFGIYLIVPFFH